MEAFIGAAVEEVALEGAAGKAPCSAVARKHARVTRAHAVIPGVPGCTTPVIRERLSARLPIAGAAELSDELFAWVWRHLRQRASDLLFTTASQQDR